MGGGEGVLTTAPSALASRGRRLGSDPATRRETAYASAVCR